MAIANKISTTAMSTNRAKVCIYPTAVPLHPGAAYVDLPFDIAKRAKPVRGEEPRTPTPSTTSRPRYVMPIPGNGPAAALPRRYGAHCPGPSTALVNPTKRGRARQLDCVGALPPCWFPMQVHIFRHMCGPVRQSDQ